MCAPSHSPYFASNITFTNPSVAPEAFAFPDAEKGNLPTLISYPLARASFSVIPTEEISGEQ